MAFVKSAIKPTPRFLEGYIALRWPREGSPGADKLFRGGTVLRTQIWRLNIGGYLVFGSIVGSGSYNISPPRASSIRGQHSEVNHHQIWSVSIRVYLSFASIIGSD